MHFEHCHRIIYRFVVDPLRREPCRGARPSGTHRPSRWPNRSTSGCLLRCRGKTRRRYATVAARVPAARPAPPPRTRCELPPPASRSPTTEEHCHLKIEARTCSISLVYSSPKTPLSKLHSIFLQTRKKISSNSYVIFVLLFIPISVWLENH